MSMAQQTTLPGMPRQCACRQCLTFVLRCIPTAQQRPRHMSTPNGFHRAYKSARQEANEQTLHALLLPHIPREPLWGSLELAFRAIFPIPMSASKREREEMLAGAIGHTTKPDLDNLTKQLKDCMTRMRFWGDDKQVVRCICSKEYGSEPRWIVTVRQIAGARRK